jgi:hypothetical protein
MYRTIARNFNRRYQYLKAKLKKVHQIIMKNYYFNGERVVRNFGEHQSLSPVMAMVILLYIIYASRKF